MKRIDPTNTTLINDYNKEEKLTELEFLRNDVKDLLDEMDDFPTPPPDLLPGLNLERQTHDYERDLELIKEETKETLDCISSLYLDDETMQKKNISNIIRNDAETICTIKFSIECAKRGLVSCMKQLDAGTTNAEMYMAVSAFQKEIRDSSKMNYELVTKMKTFYKELRTELKQDNLNISGDSLSDHPQPKIGSKENEGLFVFDPKLIDDILEERKKNPTLLDGGTF
jgi:hypothetical protein